MAALISPTSAGTKTHFEIGVDKPVSSGWKWVSATELPKNDKGARHFVVELSNSSPALGVKVHTLVDGTPILTRWLEITNKADKQIALTSVYRGRNMRGELRILG